MQLLFFSFSIVAIMITFIMGLKSVSYGLVFFAISPYFVTLYLIKIAQYETAILTARSMTLFVVVIGLYFLLDTTYMERRLGDNFSYLFIPLWQLTMLAVSGFVIYLSNSNVNETGDDI